jgi:hypothetical protein
MAFRYLSPMGLALSVPLIYSPALAAHLLDGHSANRGVLQIILRPNQE